MRVLEAPPSAAGMAGVLRHSLSERGLLRSSAIVFAGMAVARLLGFLFLVAAARLLAPADYGFLAYALALLTAASTLLTNSPGGLSRFLARYAGDRQRQEAYFSNWLAVVGLMLAASLVLIWPAAPLVRLNGWMLAAIAVNLVNIAVFETYLYTQRGLGRFTAFAFYYVLANLLQLLAILAAGAAGLRSPALFLTIYGLSAIAAVVVMEAVAPTPLRFRVDSLTRNRLRGIGSYVRPILLQGVFYALWWGADMILVVHLLPATAAGNYAAAKALTQGLILVPAAVGMAAGPHISRLAEIELRSYLLRLLGLIGALVLALDGSLALLQKPIAHLFFGAKYPHALDAVDALIAGLALYAFAALLATYWGALGRPVIGAVATGVATALTVAVALALIPSLGLEGAGLGFAAGAAAQLAVIGAYTVWGLFAGTSARVGHLPDEAVLGF